jgi:hypothetical protein
VTKSLIYHRFIEFKNGIIDFIPFIPVYIFAAPQPSAASEEDEKTSVSSA